MSLAGVHPLDIHSSHSSLTTTISTHSLDDDTSSSFSTVTLEQHVLTIEHLRTQLTSCFTCGVNWAELHVSLDCKECGDYAMDRPCPDCDGTCGAVWKRDLSMSHMCQKARWNGSCVNVKTPTNPPSNANVPMSNLTSTATPSSNTSTLSSLTSTQRNANATSDTLTLSKLLLMSKSTSNPTSKDLCDRLKNLTAGDDGSGSCTKS